MKQILTTNVSNSGNLDTDEVTNALLLHRKTQVPDIRISPVIFARMMPPELLFGPPTNDHLPQPTHFRQQWQELARLKGNTARRRYDSFTKTKPSTNLEPLDVGDSVSIENQTGCHPLRWKNTGVVAEKDTSNTLLW